MSATDPISQLVLPGFDGFRVTEARLAFSGRVALGPEDEDLIRGLVLGEEVEVVLRHGGEEVVLVADVHRKGYARSDVEAEAVQTITLRVSDEAAED